MKITGYIANFLLFSKIFSFRSNIPVKVAGIASEGRKVKTRFVPDQKI